MVLGPVSRSVPRPVNWSLAAVFHALKTHTPSILARCLPLEGEVRMASSPRVVARILAPLSIVTDPPLCMGLMTLSISNVVFAGCLFAIFDLSFCANREISKSPEIFILEYGAQRGSCSGKASAPGSAQSSAINWQG